jgi:DNA-binding transcriptional ArsR family regulator
MLGPKPEQLCGQLAEVDRLKIFAAVVLGADTAHAAAAASGLPVRSATAALRRLAQVGLVETVERGPRRSKMRYVSTPHRLTRTSRWTPTASATPCYGRSSWTGG